MPYTLFDPKNSTTYPPKNTPVIVYYSIVDYYTKGKPTIIERAIADFEEGKGRKPDFTTVGVEGFEWENSFSNQNILAWEPLPSVPEEIQTLFKKRIKKKTQ